MRWPTLTLDYETARFRPGLKSPPIVCAVVSGEGWPTSFHPTAEVETVTREALKRGIVGVNIAYDMLCAIHWTDLLPDILEAYEAGRIIDLGALERTAEISGFVPRRYRHSLESLGQFYGVPTPPKDDGVRTSFGPLWHQPIEAYSEPQLDYLRGDGDSGWKILERQLERYGDRINQADVAMLSRDLLWLAACSGAGIKSDLSKTHLLRAACEARLEELQSIAQEPQLLPARFAVRGELKAVDSPRGRRLAKADEGERLPEQQMPEPEGWARGWYEKALDALRPVRLNGSSNRIHLQAMVADAFHGSPPMTEKPRKASPKWQASISTAKATLEDSNEPTLLSLAEYGEWSSALAKDVKILESGLAHTRFGLADTTRTTSSGPNIQNFRKARFRLHDGSEVGIRECFRPREGFCYVGADYPMLEMRTVAQLLVSRLDAWHLADQINAGVDLHSKTCSSLIGKPWEWINEHRKIDPAIGKQRDLCKIPNFGKLGAMSSPRSLQKYGRGSYGVKLTLQKCSQLLDACGEAQPDIQRYLDSIYMFPRDDRGLYSIPIPGCTITRAGATFPAAANTGFQGLAARIAGRAGWSIFRATLDRNSPLYHCRLVLFVHDEFILECPLGRQTEVAAELVRLMRVAAQSLLDDINAGEPEAFASLIWSKDAKERRDAEGNLLIWEP